MTRLRRRTLRLAVVDSILFALFVLVVNVPLTGLAVHEWLGITFGVGLVVHLVEHGDWIRSTSRRFASSASLLNRLNYLMVPALFLGFATIIVSGLAISEAALPIVGITPPGGTFFLWLHLASVGWVIWLTAMHMALNWRWIVNAADRLVFRRGTGRAR